MSGLTLSAAEAQVSMRAGQSLSFGRGLRADGTPGREAEVTDDDIRARDRHRGGFLLGEDVGRRQQVLLARLGDHVDLERIGHAGLFEIGTEHSVDQADGRKVLHACETERLQLVQEDVHVAERIRAIDASEHWRFGHDGQYFAGHLQHDGVGVAISHQSCERAAAGHAIAAGIVDDDEIDATGFLALGRQAGAGAAADDGLAALCHVSEAFQQFYAFKPGHRSPR
ncbi:hypothetical protein ACVMHY_006494 [Bradyrhizobium barranii subsp. barranii]